MAKVRTAKEVKRRIPADRKPYHHQSLKFNNQTFIIKMADIVIQTQKVITTTTLKKELPNVVHPFKLCPSTQAEQFSIKLCSNRWSSSTILIQIATEMKVIQSYIKTLEVIIHILVSKCNKTECHRKPSLKNKSKLKKIALTHKNKEIVN